MILNAIADKLKRQSKCWLAVNRENAAALSQNWQLT